MAKIEKGQQPVNEGLCFLFYALLGLFLLIFYFSLKAIFFNLIEDHFNLPLHTDIFLSYQYGDKAAYLLVTTLAFFVTYYLTRRYLARGSISLTILFRIWILRLGLAIAFLSSFYDLGWILMRFFTGALDAVGLLETLVTLTLALLVFVFSYFELRAKTLTTVSMGVVFFIVGIINVSAIAIALYQAPPWQQKQMRQDLERVNKMESVKNMVSEYYKRNLKLPADLQVLIQEIAKSEQDINDPHSNQRFDYHILGKETFDLCTTFNFDSKKARRLSYAHGQANFKQGKDCIKYLVPQHFSECEKRCLEECRKSSQKQ